MAKVNGGELVVRTLRAAGVDALFGLHGAHIDTIFQACLDHGLSILDTRHEMNAGHAAEGYARTAERMGVALVTAGGGFTNVMTSIANAWLDRTPVLYITGSGALRDAETNTLQAGIDQVGIAGPITKWAYRITATDQIPRLLSQAIRIANSGPRGPVLIDIPWDVLTGEIEEASTSLAGHCLAVERSVPGPECISAALQILNHAQRPVIVVGSEARRAKAGPALCRLVEATGIPAFADFEGLGLLAELGEANAGLVQGLYTFGSADAAPDAVLMLGTRFGMGTAHGSGLLIPHDATVIQVDPDARELGRLQNIALAIESDVGGAVEMLAAAALNQSWPDRADWRQRVRSIVDARREGVLTQASDCTSLHPLQASAELVRQIGPGQVVVADGALTYLWLSEVIAQARPRAFLCHGYLGSMGIGMGIALGAQQAERSSAKRVILVTGDGSIGYSLGEFDTLVRHKLPVIVVVMNNRSWGATLHFQQLAVGANRVVNTRLENGAYEQVAIGLGASGYFADTLEGFSRALASALASDGPACINVRVALDPVPPEEAILMGANPFGAE